MVGAPIAVIGNVADISRFTVSKPPDMQLKWYLT
jgi:hypothetical protein